VFYITAGIFFFGGIFYHLFNGGERGAWVDQDNERETLINGKDH
jgi:hypothetical protein